jgi:hypothetical protein
MKTIPLSDDLRHQIISTLQPLSPYKVILFGSYAYGKPNRYRRFTMNYADIAIIAVMMFLIGMLGVFAFGDKFIKHSH